ncbi:MAG TPA: Na(+)/H(+) antiporter subunit B [Geminicoccaceae bacterium]|nr:Na(+)/H(+) antiporter subunit B [Geminicoccus sp.]HMU48994.1 Na(+)/H(+) antiporter subunit B [Geminicoccaceae bacterium]
MTLPVAFDAALAALVLAMAAWVVLARTAFAATVGFVACGLLLTLAWFGLGAPDVAMTEAAIGSGVTGALLIGAAARQPAGEGEDDRPGRLVRIAIAVLCAAVAAAIAAAVLLLPDPAPSLTAEAVASLPATGVGNPVTAVLMAYRALDTLLEMAVLVLALLAVWSLAPDHAWGGRPGPAPSPAPEPLVFLARLLPPAGIVVGVHLLWTGADHPGGAFQGGTVLGAMWLLLWMAGLAPVPATGGRTLRVVLVAGVALFVAVGLAGLPLAGAFLAYPPSLAKPLILLVEAAKILSVAAAMALLVAGPPLRRPS